MDQWFKARLYCISHEHLEMNAIIYTIVSYTNQLLMMICRLFKILQIWTSAGAGNNVLHAVLLTSWWGRQYTRTIEYNTNEGFEVLFRVRCTSCESIVSYGRVCHNGGCKNKGRLL